MKFNKISGFTLLEVLIVVALLAIIGTAIIILFNPIQQINKAWDSKKKSDLNVLKKSFEDYYNDKGCYPTLEKVCYNAKSQYATDEAKICNICGSNPLSPSFTPYITSLPCDPRSPKSEFLYQVDNLVCPKWFKVYSELNYKIDPIINELGCFAESCGPKPNFGYDFAVTSPNIDIEKASSYYCLNNYRNCNSCGLTHEDCVTRLTCQLYKKFYSSSTNCCTDNNICRDKYYCTYAVTGECIECGYSAAECSLTGQCEMEPISTIKRGSCP